MALGTGTIKKDMTKVLQEIRDTVCRERCLVFLSSNSPVNFPRLTAIAADNAEGIYEVHGKKLPPMFLSSNNGYFRIYHPLINGVQMVRANK